MKFNWNNIECDFCHKKFNSPLDLLVWNSEIDNGKTVITEISWRHHGRNNGCDSKYYLKSIHVHEKDWIEDILNQWKLSPYNK